LCSDMGAPYARRWAHCDAWVSARLLSLAVLDGGDKVCVRLAASQVAMELASLGRVGLIWL
jgi:hypothetical protein